MTELLRTEGISKSFPGVKALSDVSLVVNSGEILALIGENGAGKSTLMKILTGVQPPDSGDIFIDGEKVVIKDPLEAKKHGIGIVFQELSLADNMTVAENIYALEEPTKAGFVDYRAMKRGTQEVLDRLGFDVDPTALVGSLSVSQQQLVEIAKVLRTEPRVLILDEPTSALSEREVEQLFEVLNRLRDEGIGIVYISHKMNEIFLLTDRCSVLRDGVHVGEAVTKDTTPDQLIAMMVGRSLDATFPPRWQVPADGPVVLKLTDFTRPGRFEDINLEVRAGEIVGLYGLMGAGRTELAQGIFGVEPATSGTMELDGVPISVTTPSKAVSAGIAYASEDRKGNGLVLPSPVTANTTMANLGAITSRLGFLNMRRESDITKKAVDNFKIKISDVSHAVGNLSGGNQQKVVLAKWVETDPKLLILDEPTRGIDVGAKYEIYLLMQRLAERGVGIIMISSELPEILSVANRVYVMNDHKIIAEIDPEREGAEEIMTHITGAPK